MCLERIRGRIGNVVIIVVVEFVISEIRDVSWLFVSEVFLWNVWLLV